MDNFIVMWRANKRHKNKNNTWLKRISLNNKVKMLICKVISINLKHIIKVDSKGRRYQQDKANNNMPRRKNNRRRVKLKKVKTKRKRNER